MIIAIWVKRVIIYTVAVQAAAGTNGWLSTDLGRIKSHLQQQLTVGDPMRQPDDQSFPTTASWIFRHTPEASEQYLNTLSSEEPDLRVGVCRDEQS